MRIRLRRSDFYLGDYPKRQAWRLIRQALRDPEGDQTLAWALKRCTARGAHALLYRSRWLALQIAMGRLATEGDRPMGYVARAALRQAMAVHLPDDQAFMRALAHRMCP